MIPHPQMAVDMSEKALDEAGHPELAMPIMKALIGRLHRREHHGA